MQAQNFEWIRTKNSGRVWTMWHKTIYKNSYNIRCGQRLLIDSKTKIETSTTPLPPNPGTLANCRVCSRCINT